MQLLYPRAAGLDVHKAARRKTDIGDAQWLGDLLRHGLLRASYVPPRPQRELRELIRHRNNLVQRRVQVITELHKILELANLKLGAVATDVTGVSATAMLHGLLAGISEPAVLAELAQGRLKRKKEQLAKALSGRLREHHPLILDQQLAEIHALGEAVDQVGLEITRPTETHHELMNRLDEIPGVNTRVAEVIIAELGTNPTVF